MGKKKRATETDWVAYTDPQPMLSLLPETASARKQTLFACACCRRIWRLLTDARSRRAVEVMERYSDGLADESERERAGREALAAYKAASGNAAEAADAAAHAFESEARFRPFRAMVCAKFAVGKRAGAAEAASQCLLVRDIFGNPFRPITPEPAWRTPAVVSLATAAYEERLLPAGTLDADRLAVLADALEEAGCDNADILSHLRGPGPHVRGCWVVDQLLCVT
jgi:hypothetical protein